MTTLEKISHETMRFMRGLYRLDEIGDGCFSPACYCKDDPCHAKACAKSDGGTACKSCGDYPCVRATAADHRSMIHVETHAADDVTWGILPYVPQQYEDVSF